MDWKIGDDTTSYYCVRTVTIHFHVDVLFKRMGSPYVCIGGEPTKGLYFQGQSTSRFSAFPSSLPRRLNTQESSMQNGSFKFVCNESDWIFETCHGATVLNYYVEQQNRCMCTCTYKKHYTYSSWNMNTYWKTYYSMSTEGPTAQTHSRPPTTNLLDFPSHWESAQSWILWWKHPSLGRCGNKNPQTWNLKHQVTLRGFLRTSPFFSNYFGCTESLWGSNHLCRGTSQMLMHGLLTYMT